MNYRRLESELIIDYIINKKLLFNHSIFVCKCQHSYHGSIFISIWVDL